MSETILKGEKAANVSLTPTEIKRAPTKVISKGISAVEIGIGGIIHGLVDAPFSSVISKVPIPMPPELVQGVEMLLGMIGSSFLKNAHIRNILAGFAGGAGGKLATSLFARIKGISGGGGTIGQEPAPEITITESTAAQVGLGGF